MASIVISVDTWTKSVGGYNPDDSWSRDSSEGGISAVHARTLREGEDEHSYYYGMSWQGELDVLPGDTVFAVVAAYTTGDTFGYDGGNAQVLDAFVYDDRAKAYELQKAAEKATYGGFTFYGKEYYPNWVGYFESLDSLQVYPVVVGV
jgi:hypothetical protein